MLSQSGPCHPDAQPTTGLLLASERRICSRILERVQSVPDITRKLKLAAVPVILALALILVARKCLVMAMPTQAPARVL